MVSSLAMSTSRPGGTRFAMRGNTRVAYDPGSQTDPNAPAVVMLHALLADRSVFAAQRDALSDRYRVILPDARGHGASATLANQWYTVGELAQDVLAILDAEGITRAHLVGHELGGATALAIAQQAPERVASLVLIEPAVAFVLDGDPDSHVVTTRNETRSADREAGDAAYKGLTDKALDGYIGPRWGPSWRQEITKPRFGAVRRHAGALAGILPALDAFKIDRADLRAITVSTLLLIAEDTTPVARITTERLASLLPNASLECIRLGSRANDPFGADSPDLTRHIEAQIGSTSGN
jgi:pimeloyl-ACP methyl ester carboxylesterase